MKYIPIIILAMLLLIGACPVSGFLSGYGYYQDATLSNSGSELTNYQVKFVVDTGTGSSSGSTVYLKSHAASDLDDLRFTDTSDNLYSYWIESASSPYTVWVEVPSIPNGDSTLRVQYGNGAATAVSDGPATFLFFDTFDGDLAKWTGDTASGSVGSSILTFTGATSTQKNLYGTYTSTASIALRVRAKIPDSSFLSIYMAENPNDNTDIVGFYTDAGTTDSYVTKKAGGSTGILSQELSDAANYHLYDIVRLRTTDTAKIYRDGTQKGSDATTNVPTVAVGAYVGSYGANPIYVDWAAIRTIAATEPTVSTWGSESVPATPTPTPTATPTATPTPVPAGQIGVYSYESNYIIWSVGPNQTAILLDGVLTNVTNSTSSMVYGQYDLQAGSTHIACPLNGTCMVVNLHDDAISIWLTWGAYLLLIFLAIISYKFPITFLPTLIYGLWLIGVYLPDIGASGLEFVMVGILMVMSVIMSALGMRKI